MPSQAVTTKEMHPDLRHPWGLLPSACSVIAKGPKSRGLIHLLQLWGRVWACPVRLDQLVPIVSSNKNGLKILFCETKMSCACVKIVRPENNVSWNKIGGVCAWLIHETWKHVFRAGYELIPSGRISSYLEHPFRDFSSCICTSCVLCVHKSMTKVVHV